MKRSFLMALCLSVVSAFAGPNDISSFDAQDVGTPDEYITAEFGGELKTAPASEVATLQKGRLVVRQKFEDPFGESETMYQLYQGAAGDLSSLTALSAPAGASYSDLVKAKFYEREDMDPNDDIEKVYFDGKFVYVPGKSTAVVYLLGTPLTLESAAPVAESEEVEEAPAPEPVAAPAAPAAEECDEYDPDCEDEDEDEYDVAGDLNKTNRDADERDNSADYAADDAGENAIDRFGIADEVRFWSAVALSAAAAASAVLGVLQHMESNKARDAYDKLDETHSKIYNKILEVCSANSPESVGACATAMSYYDMTGSGYSLKTLEARMDVNKKTQDSYATARNIWFGVTGVTLTAAIVLFVW